MTEKKIWTPGQKLPDRVKQIALLLFLERWKTSTAGRAQLPDIVAETGQAYRMCIEAAKAIYEVEMEEQK